MTGIGFNVFGVRSSHQRGENSYEFPLFLRGPACPVRSKGTFGHLREIKPGIDDRDQFSPLLVHLRLRFWVWTSDNSQHLVHGGAHLFRRATGFRRCGKHKTAKQEQEAYSDESSQENCFQRCAYNALDLTLRPCRRVLAFDVVELSLPLTAIIRRELPHRVLDAPLILLCLANHCRFLSFTKHNPARSSVDWTTFRAGRLITDNKHHSFGP